MGEHPFTSLRIAQGAAKDRGFVMSSWRLSYAQSEFARFATPRKDWQQKASELYWDWQTSIIERLLDASELWVAYWVEDRDALVGWCVMSGDVVHYVYVKGQYRRNGAAKMLLAPALEQSRVTYTHRTPICSRLPIPAGWTYDPRPAIAPKEAA